MTIQRVLVVTGALMAVACTHVHYVERSPAGGTLALEGNRDRAMNEARGEMRDHCGGEYRIIEQGTAIRPAHEPSDPMGVNDPQQSYVQASAGETHRDDYALEYHVTYICEPRRAETH
jgi:hypothetical protein